MIGTASILRPHPSGPDVEELHPAPRGPQIDDPQSGGLRGRDLRPAGRGPSGPAGHPARGTGQRLFGGAMRADPYSE
jgi:hypothetical protein